MTNATSKTITSIQNAAGCVRTRVVYAVLLLSVAVSVLSAQAPVSPVPRQQFFDNSGIPVNGGKLCTYQAGTTTPLVTFTDSALSVQNTNPIILDSAGRPSNGSVEVGIYLSAASYKFILMTAGTDSTCATGVTLWTQDNVLAFNYLTSAAGLATGSPSTTTFLRGDMTWAKAWTVVTSTSTGTLNDFAPGLVGNTIVRMNNATLATITGLSGGFDGQRVILESVGAGQVDEAYATSAAGLGSLAQNRLFNLATSGNTSEAPGVGVVEYVYDGTSTRWRLVAHEQGDWITPTYNGPDWTASAGTWTVDAGDVLANRYYLRGRKLDYQISVNATSVSTTPATLLAKAFGFTVNGRVDGYALVSDAGAAGTPGQSITAAAGTTIPFSKLSGNWSVATNTTAILSQGTIPVQD